MNPTVELLQRHCHEQDAPTSVIDRVLFTGHDIDTYANGLDATVRQVGVGENSWLSGLILVLLVLLAFNINHCRRMFAMLPQNLFEGRRDSTHTFESRTSGEVRSAFLSVLMLCVSEGILLFAACRVRLIGVVGESGGFGPALLLAAVAGVYYVFQLCAYNVIGFVFADRDATRSWVRGFNASQILLSMLLLIPALMALFYPSGSYVMIWVAVVCYIACRVIFILKGVKIFFKNYPSFLYFILYLCALEIVPLLIIREVILRLFNFFS